MFLDSYPQTRINIPQQSFLKQKAEISSGNILDKIEDYTYSSSLAVVRDLFSPTQ